MAKTVRNSKDGKACSRNEKLRLRHELGHAFTFNIVFFILSVSTSAKLKNICMTAMEIEPARPPGSR